MKEEKKVYPSQINTKAVACRVSTAEYVEILKEASQMGITVNDWLLMKIYEGKVNNGLKNALNGTDSYSPTDEPNMILVDKTINSNALINKEGYWINTVRVKSILDVLRDSDLKLDLEEGKVFEANEYLADIFISVIKREQESKDKNKLDDVKLSYFVFGLCALYPTLLKTKLFKIASEANSIIAEFESNINYNKTPSIQNAITQLQLIAKEEFEPKDYREFMKDLHELISDLR